MCRNQMKRCQFGVQNGVVKEPHWKPDIESRVSLLDSIVVSIPACHAGDRGSIPRPGSFSTNTVSAIELR